MNGLYMFIYNTYIIYIIYYLYIYIIIVYIYISVYIYILFVYICISISIYIYIYIVYTYIYIYYVFVFIYLFIYIYIFVYRICLNTKHMAISRSRQVAQFFTILIRFPAGQSSTRESWRGEKEGRTGLRGDAEIAGPKHREMIAEVVHSGKLT